MLLQGPASGYALRQRIEQSVGNFWQESYGQLYPALEALAASGLVESVDNTKDGRDTRVWHITKAGREALAGWVARPPVPQRERNELLLKLSFAELAPESVRRHLESARDDAQRELDRLKRLRVDVAQRAHGQQALPLWLATIDYGIAGQDALARWCEQTLAALTRAPPPGRRTNRS